MPLLYQHFINYISYLWPRGIVAASFVNFLLAIYEDKRETMTDNGMMHHSIQLYTPCPHAVIIDKLLAILGSSKFTLILDSGCMLAY